MEKLSDRLYNWASDIDEVTKNQAFVTSKLPILAGHLALMPDAHLGAGATIGSVIPTKGAIIPNAVGVDLGCVDADTEYLSPYGWRRIADWPLEGAIDGDLVMQYDPETGEGKFVAPQSYWVLPCDEFYWLHTKYGVNQMLSGEHTVLYAPYDRSSDFSKTATISADDLVEKHESLKGGFRGRFLTTFTPTLHTSLPYSDAELRVAVMVAADGHVEGERVYLRFKRGRKIERARKLFADAGVMYSEGLSNDGVTMFKFRFGKAVKSLGGFWGASLSQLQLIVQEAFKWDGSEPSSGSGGMARVFFTRDKPSADFMHYAITAVGYRAVLRQDDHYRDGQTDYRVYAHTNTKVGINGSPKTPIERVPSPDGNKYCFTLPSGFWVMRRGGNIAMTGNCGMIAVKLNFGSSSLPDDGNVILDAIMAAVPAGLGKWHGTASSEADSWLRRHSNSNLTTEQIKKAAVQFGTLGSGNHFFEVCLDQDDQVWIIMHSGSRGVGNQLAQSHVKIAKVLAKEYMPKDFVQQDPQIAKELSWLQEGTPEFADYIHDMQWAQDYAMANRRQMMDMALGALVKVVGGGVPSMWVNCHHNFAQKEVHSNEEIWVTRKGAIKADKGDLGLIPGSMGGKSYVVSGLGNTESYTSCSHGAGRRMSRTQAKKTLSLESFHKVMGSATWQSKQDKELLDEHPDSYKDLDVVMNDQKDLVEVLYELKAVVNYKGTS